MTRHKYKLLVSRSLSSVANWLMSVSFHYCYSWNETCEFKLDAPILSFIKFILPILIKTIYETSFNFYQNKTLDIPNPLSFPYKNQTYICKEKITPWYIYVILFSCCKKVTFSTFLVKRSFGSCNTFSKYAIHLVLMVTGQRLHSL